MIIVKTSNGDRFINDAEMLQVSHVKDKAQVEVWPSRWGNQQQQPQYFVIENVEAVIYTTQTTEWKDEGSKLEKLKKDYSEHLKWGDNLRQKYMDMEIERDQLKEEVKNLRNRIQTMEDMNAGSKQKQNICLRSTSPIGGDGTQAFNVENCEGMTAIEFIMNVIKKDPYVSIDFKRDDEYIWSGEYEHNKLKKKHDGTMPEILYTSKVKSARAAGGWGQMDYNVKLY